MNGRVAVNLHHEERQEVQRAGKGHIEQERHQVCAVEVPGAEQRGRHHRILAAPLDEDEGRKSDHAEDQGGEHHWVTETQSRRLDQTVRPDPRAHSWRGVRPRGPACGPPGPSSRARATARWAIATTASTGVIRNAARQETSSTSQPPNSGPTAIAVPLSADQAPIALALRFPSNDAPTIASDAGTRSAPPAPCTALAATSCPEPGARAHQAEAAAKIAAPRTKMRRLP